MPGPAASNFRGRFPWLKPVAIWHADHVVLPGFDLFESQLEAFHAGERPNYELMIEIVDLRQYGDRFHHPREEVAFERLVERDPGTRLPVNRLLQEHRVIARAGDEVLERREIVEDVMIERAAVEAAAATYLVHYRHHLTTEEQGPAARR